MKYGPGHDGFAWQADTYCVECGEHIVKSLTCLNVIDSGDSGQFPQPIFFGESDSEVYCADCGDFMYGENDEPYRAGDRDDYRPETNPLYRQQMKDAGRGNQLP
jgi:ribosomal protein S27E